MAKKKRGRPKLKKSNQKTNILRIRLSPSERRKLDKKAGKNTSAWARDVLLRAAADDNVEVDQPGIEPGD